jgi:ribosomal protein S27E
LGFQKQNNLIAVVISAIKPDCNLIKGGQTMNNNEPEYFEGEKCPKCENGTLETYFNDKADTVVLSCDSCQEVIDERAQEE